MIWSTRTILVWAAAAVVYCSEPARAQFATERGGSAGCTEAPGTLTHNISAVDVRLVANGNLFASFNDIVRYEVPAGSGIRPLRSAGLWIAGRAGEAVKSSIAHREIPESQFHPGPLDGFGMPLEDCSNYARIWTVSTDDLIEYESTGQPALHLTQWPTGLGAPTVDASGQLIDLADQPLEQRLTRLVDLEAGERPAMKGHRMSWWIMNDVGIRDTATAMFLEIHNTAYSVEVDGPLGNTTFYETRVFARGDNSLSGLHIGVQADVNLGLHEHATGMPDDYVGVDVDAGLAYAYNADDNDEKGYGDSPAAIGLKFLDGPAISSFLAYAAGDGPTGDPATSEEYYNYLRGLWKDGEPVTYGETGYGGSGTETTFMFDGSPPEYWSELDVDGLSTANNPTGGRRFVVSTGPTDLERGSVVDLSYALVWAYGESNLGALDALRSAASEVAGVFSDGSYPEPNFVPQVAQAVIPEYVQFGVAAGRDTTVAVHLRNLGGNYYRWAVTSDLNPTFSDFLVTRNAAGPLDPPEYGAFTGNDSGFPHPTTDGIPTAGRQQSESDAVWGIHAWDATGFDTFLSQVLRPHSEGRLGNDDYELRFTTEGSSAMRIFDDSALVHVPFELWRIGSSHDEDDSDDVRLVPVLCEACRPELASGAFDIGGDHAVSPGADDPYTEPIYWYEPVSLAPGRGGYDAFLEPPHPLGGEIMARMVLVQLDGGTAPPYEPALPEEGTVFQIRTGQDVLQRAKPTEGAVGPFSAGDVNLELVAPQTPARYVDTLTVETNVEHVIQVVIDVANVEHVLSVDAESTLVYHFVNGSDTVATITFLDAGSVSEVSLLEHTTDAPPGLEPALTRYFDVSTIGDGYEATLELHYHDDDLIDGSVTSDESDLELIRWNGTRWVYAGGLADGEHNTVTLSGLTGLGRFAIADPEVVFLGTNPDALDGQLALEPVYPNPVADVAHVGFTVPTHSRVRLDLFDLLGRRVAVLRDDLADAGSHVIPYDVGSLPSGVYFVRLTSGSESQVRSLVVVR